MKLHIGCGKKYLPGYKHVDVIDYEHVDYICDARKLSMIENESVTEIYACHILEHVERDEVVKVLREWSRVLKVGGTIRVAVPNFEAVVEEYVENKNLTKVLGLLYGGQTYDYNFHHVTFDYVMLEALFEEVGFGEVCKYEWRDFLPNDYDDFSRAYLPHMSIDTGRLMSLNMQAIKR